MTSGVVTTYNNEVTLNALLWSLAMSFALPDEFVILNHGRRLQSPFVHKAISYLSKRIPVKIRRMKNPGYDNTREIRKRMALLATGEWLWILDDDAYVAQDCFRIQQGYGKACLPYCIDEDVWFDGDEEMGKTYATEEVVRVRRGGILGLLVRREDVLVALSKMPWGQSTLEDDFILRYIKVDVLPTAMIMHQGSTEPSRPWLYKRIEEFERYIDAKEGREWTKK